MRRYSRQRGVDLSSVGLQSAICIFECEYGGNIGSRVADYPLNWAVPLNHVPQADLDEAARAADARREALGAAVACPLR